MYHSKSLYNRQPLGLDITIDSENVDYRTALAAGAMEGASDVAKIAVAAGAVLVAYMIIPDNVLKSVARRARSILQ